MDTSTDRVNQNYATLLSMPAHIWVGPHAATQQKAKALFKQMFCQFNTCGKCIICNQIEQQQHPSLIWVCPEKQYTLEHLESIFKAISFSLEENSHCFFILQKAETLSAACANSLLKSMEEPPAGYHFLLLTERSDAILPTIRSRCLITHLHTSFAPTAYQDLFKAITNPTAYTPTQFLKIVESSKISEHESLMLLDALLTFWSNAYKQTVQKNDSVQLTRIDYCITVISKAITNPPMPGSSALLWKNIFLQLAR